MNPWLKWQALRRCRFGWARAATALLMVALAMGATGCSPLIGDPRLREQQLDSFLAQPERMVLFFRGGLQADEQLKVLRREAIIAPLVREFDPVAETRGLIEHFVAAVPPLADSATRIVDPHEWRDIDLPGDTPVLFFSASWRMAYQRWPLNLARQRMQVGVIAKVVPLGQVLSGKGTIALRTAAWEGACLFDAYDGDYFLIEQWQADDAVMLRQAIGAAQRACGEQLAREFLQEVAAPR